MTNEKVSRPEKFKLENRDERITKNLDKLPKASGLDFQKHSIGNINSNEVIDVSEFISRKEFEQFEKRIDDKFDTINSKIDNLPSILEDKIEKHVSSAKLQLIIWIVGTSIASGGVLIALLTFVAKLIGLY